MVRIRQRDSSDFRRRILALGYIVAPGQKHEVYTHPVTGDRVLLSHGCKVGNKTLKLLQMKLRRLENDASEPHTPEG